MRKGLNLGITFSYAASLSGARRIELNHIFGVSELEADLNVLQQVLLQALLEDQGLPDVTI